MPRVVWSRPAGHNAGVHLGVPCRSHSESRTANKLIAPDDDGIFHRSNAASVLACPRLFSRRPACDSSGNAIDESRPAYHARPGMHSWPRASRQNPSSWVRVLSRGSRTSSKHGCVNSKRSGNGPPGSGPSLACRAPSLGCLMSDNAPERDFIERTTAALVRQQERERRGGGATNRDHVGRPRSVLISRRGSVRIVAFGCA